MTPGARIQAAITLCEKIQASHQPPDGLIAEYFRKRRYAGSKDRRAVIEFVYGVLRNSSRLDWRIREAGLGASPRARVIAYLVLCEKTSLADLFKDAPYHPVPLSENEQTLLGLAPPLEHPSMESWTTFEYPEWLDGRLRASFGDTLEAEMAALNEAAPVDVRVNTLKGSRASALQALMDEGVEAALTKLSPLALRISSRVRLDATKAFRSGLIEVQDEGSQLIALMVHAKPGMDVLDMCAGAGGKTLALAAVMKGGKGLVASDVSERRMAAMNKRLARAGTAKIERHIFNSEDDAWLTENREKFDRVLVDVPCAGSGAWRRDPTAKQRLTMGELRNATAAQREILKKAAGLVKPGGRLIYATCSVLKAENEDQIQWFQEKHKDFVVTPAPDVWQKALGFPCPNDAPYLHLSPASTDTDGFFVAVLEKE